MDDKFRNILDGLPEKPPRSRLEPYRELIDEMRRRGRTYREIAGILAEKCQLQVSVSTVHDYVRVQSRAKRRPANYKRHPIAPPRVSRTVVTPRTTRVSMAKQGRPPIDEVQERIAALKLRSAPAKASPKQFQYDPNEPLHLPAKTGRNRSGK